MANSHRVLPVAVAAAAIVPVTLLAASGSASAGAKPALHPATKTTSYMRIVTAAPHSSDAYAVGYQYSGSKNGEYVVRKSGGSWKKITGVYPSTDSFVGIAAGSAHSVWMVGSDSSNGVILHSTGGKFKKQKLPKLGGFLTFTGVAADSPSDAWAVGSVSGTTGGPVILHYNGHKWSRAKVPSAAATDQLGGVSASSKHNAWIYCDSAPTGRATLRWNGHSWKAIALPTSTTQVGNLTISTGGVKNTWLVGSVANTSDTRYTTYAIHWTDKAWKVVKTPNPYKYSYLTGVAAVGSTAFAVGSGSKSNGLTGTRAIVMQYHGGSWHKESARNRGDNTELAAVAAGSSKSAVAVGAWYPGAICGGPPSHAYSETFDGHWSAPAIPSLRPAC